MNWEAWHTWVVLGLLLMMAELIGGEFILLALGIAFLVGAAVAGFTPLGLAWQIGAAAIAAAILVPSFVRWYRKTIKPARKGLAGEGGAKGHRTRIVDYGGRMGIRFQGDFFPAQALDNTTLAVGTAVTVEYMKGITAFVVHDADSPTAAPTPQPNPTQE